MTTYSVHVHRMLPHSEWDESWGRQPAAHTSKVACGARSKTVVGWRAIRLLVHREGKIAGGCQLLLRSLPVVGAVAYVPRGPVMAERSGRALEVVLNALREVAKEERIIYLKLQPPPDGAYLAGQLQAHGFVPSDLEIAPRATTRIDLHRSPASVLGLMHTNARRNIAKARQIGVTVREGAETDLSIFTALVEETARRQSFSPYPPSYYEQNWRAFAAGGQVQLFIAEHEGAVLASNLVIGSGDTATYKMGAWSGTRRNVPPNELLHLVAIEWAQKMDYHYYDLDDISLNAAEAVLSGGRLDTGRGLERFKLGLGGEVLVFPGPYDYSVRPLMGAALRRLAPQAERFRPLIDRILGRGRAAARLSTTSFP
jgi:lipid II:glycine glycyltransferase (peptidoglycan interpeptide bridge formation enzyme)